MSHFRHSLPLTFALLATVASRAQTATRPMAQAHAAAAAAQPQAPAAAPVAAPSAAPASSQMAPVRPSGADLEAGTVIEGAMIYDHLGEDDPFYPAGHDCRNKKYALEHVKECEGPSTKKGCMRFKLEQLSLTGVTDTLGLPIAMLTAENKPYFVKIGDECGDAKVLEIDVKTTCVKWRQELTAEEAANALRPYKDVFQCLRGLPPAAAGVR